MRSFLNLPSSFVLLLSALVTPSNAFTFRFSSEPSQCGATSIVWQGGTPPYKVLLVPVDFMPQGTETRVIFDRTVTSGNELGFNFPFPANSRFVAVMSDATGFGTGGTSPILTVASSNSSSCLPTTPSAPQFYLYLSPTTPTQCSPVTISWDRPRNPPVTVYGIIPQGQSFDLHASSRANGGSSFDWAVNVRSGTPLFFVAGDGNGAGTGGSSDVSNVRTGSSSCINPSSPSATEDAGVGSVGSFPNSGNGGTSTGVATATQTVGSGSNGSGNGNGTGGDGSGGGGGGNTGDNGSGGNGNGSNGSGSGNGSGGGSDNGSGGGTVHGPLDPTSIAGAANGNSSGPNIPMILGIVFGLIGLTVIVVLLALWYKRRKAAQKRRENQRARMLAIGDFSQTHLPQNDGAAPDLPHPRPAFSNLPWAGGSLESLGTNLRTTPFIWPLGNGSNANSPVDRRSAGPSPRDRDASAQANVDATGTSTARPTLEHRSTSSSGVLRRLRSTYANGSGLGFGFPFGRGTGYRSLGDGDDNDNTTPSSGPPNTTNNNSGSGVGHTVNHSDSSSSAMHKSPLPPRYQNQHASQNSHGSDGSRVSALAPAAPVSTDITPLMSGGDATLTRPGPAPLGPRPAPGSTRPSFGREDTGGSIWEVPPTYASLRRHLGRHE
ncbi:hypothetical protein M408DRAFT_18387 [Serendipita vermifera MAFF 305830]|uniref:Reelin domain-containing protein n=1 Tax=Serendipita vermifera MAFF 305830 TaxID=933852 RepID=A0A0C3AA28_SERVB|nr:hypothetical protein M408DRAFT_18387 [Serendipita vermifera MAFF 305830]